jgi:hypothetical protein
LVADIMQIYSIYCPVGSMYSFCCNERHEYRRSVATLVNVKTPVRRMLEAALYCKHRNCNPFNEIRYVHL